MKNATDHTCPSCKRKIKTFRCPHCDPKSLKPRPSRQQQAEWEREILVEGLGLYKPSPAKHVVGDQ